MSDPALFNDIAAFIRRGAGDEGAFNALALRLFAHQYTHNAPYRRFCDGRGVTPQTADRWQDIPPAPAAAFKRFALTCAGLADCDPAQGGRVFHSSGTTGAETSRHYLDAPALDLYRVSLHTGFARFVLADGAALPVYALMFPPDDAPHSSLSFMLDELVARYSGGFFWGDGWQARLCDAFHSTVAAGEPVCVFGTAFAWVQWADSLPVGHRWKLPNGSRLVETGGFKGRSREVSRDDLYATLSDTLGVPPARCLAEYGMSEMASQYYDSSLHDLAHSIVRPPRKVGPPWVRTRVLDPVTGLDAPPGTPGLLVHYDLANGNSVLALQTEDMGIAAPGGAGFTLLGRAPGAVLRGCSLVAEAGFAPTS